MIHTSEQPIHTREQIEEKLRTVKGTHIKRQSLRKKLKENSNREVNNRIDKLKEEIRALKACGIKDQALSPVYAKITQLEMRIL